MSTCIGGFLDSRTRSSTPVASLLVAGLIELVESCDAEACLLWLKNSLTTPSRAQEFICRHVEDDVGVEALDGLSAVIEVFCELCLGSEFVVRRRRSGSASMT